MYVFGMLFFYSTFSYCVKARIDHGFLESNPFQYLEEQQYSYENHTVVTEDGYRLLLVRILHNNKESPSNTKRPPILLVHGLFSSFIDFLLIGPKKAFAFKALEQGYDVFLLNARGNRWSRNHISLDPDKDVTKFWNFSWHQIGMYDLPATIDYILNVTAYSKISYVGFSQGCTSFFVMTSTRPEYNRVIRIAALLSPVSFLGDAQFIFFKIFKHLIGFLQVVQKTFHIHEALPYIPALSRIVQFICGPQSILLPACKRIIYEAAGPSTQIYDFEYLEDHKYKYENHTVITEDGYRLLLVRIPHDKNESSSNTTKPPILLVHAIGTNFFDFLVTGPNIAFGFQALEQDYDVFLLNVRGNRWSRSHVSLDPDKDAKKFWNFSWHEIGIYDLPATIDYILDITKFSKISYVGYSQGCTAFLVMASTRPEYNKKVIVASLLAPVAYLGHAKFILIKLLRHIVRFVQVVIEALSINEIVPYSPFIFRIEPLICHPRSIFLVVCKKVFYESTGPSAQMNDSIIYYAFTNFPSGASAKQLLHFLQSANSNEFRLYDYGKNKNMLEYGQSEPPNYNLSSVSSPVALYYGDSDYFVDMRDAARLAKNLPNIIRNVVVPFKKTDHLDAVFGSKAKDLFTQPALDVLNEYNNL